MACGSQTQYREALVSLWELLLHGGVTRQLLSAPGGFSPSSIPRGCSHRWLELSTRGHCLGFELGWQILGKVTSQPCLKCRWLQHGASHTKVFQLLQGPRPTLGTARPSLMVVLSSVPPAPGIILAKAHTHLQSAPPSQLSLQPHPVPKPSWEEEPNSKNRGSEPVHMERVIAFTAEAALTVYSPKHAAAALCC